MYNTGVDWLVCVDSGSVLTSELCLARVLANQSFTWVELDGENSMGICTNSWKCVGSCHIVEHENAGLYPMQPFQTWDKFTVHWSRLCG